MKRVLAILGAALVAALGLLMPRLTAAYQDRGLAGEVRQIENAAVSLPLAEETVELTELDLFQSLDLFSLASSAAELEEGRCMSAVDAARAAGVLGLALSADVYLEDDNALPDQAVPYLLADGYGRGGVFWRCGWEERPGEAIWVDDRNGVVVGFRLRCSAVDFPMNSLPARELCQDICGFIFPQPADADVFWADDDELVFVLSGGGDSVVLPMYFAAETEYLYFNIQSDKSALLSGAENIFS